MPDPFKLVVEIPQSRIKLGTEKFLEHLKQVKFNSTQNVLGQVDEYRVWCSDEFFDKLLDHPEIKTHYTFYKTVNKFLKVKPWNGKWCKFDGIEFVVKP